MGVSAGLSIVTFVHKDSNRHSVIPQSAAGMIRLTQRNSKSVYRITQVVSMYYSPRTVPEPYPNREHLIYKLLFKVAIISECNYLYLILHSRLYM